MSWVETVFQRDAIYKEIWAEPLATVAKRYDISDVGLRKICQKLAVPVPPLGYWAKVAAGKKTRVTPLPAGHRGPETHVRRVHMDPAAPECESRIASAISASRPNAWPVIVVPEVVDDVHALLRLTAKTLSSRSSDAAKLLRSSGHSAFAVTVSRAQRDRALRILHACLIGFTSAGAKAIGGEQNGHGPHLRILEQFVGFKLEELMDRSLREPTAKERARRQYRLEAALALDLHVPLPLHVSRA